MLKAMVWKEFRELLPAIVAAVALQAFTIYAIVGARSKLGVHKSDLHGTVMLLAQIGLLFAVVVGIWQNKAEKNQGTFLFLLHRPIRREAIVGAKLLAGVSLCLMMVAVPLACFSFWAERKSFGMTDGRSSLWSISAPFCAGIVLVYLGAFMSSVREAAWYKSQFFPLLAAIAIFISVATLASWWTPMVLIAMPVLEACFVVAILYEAMTRNYS